MEAILKVSNLKKIYPKFILENINFEIYPKEIVGLIGQNGAGKSTLLKILMNILDKDFGEFNFLGKKISKEDYLYKKDIGFVGENSSFYENQTLNHIKKFYSLYFSNWDEVLYHTLLKDTFDLDENKKFKELSKGMKVKFYMTLCLSHHPKLFILDEPTSGLDPIVRGKILNILRNHVSETHSGMIFSSHITEDMNKIADKLIFIHNGRILNICYLNDIVSHNITVEEYYENLLRNNGVKYE